MGDQLDRVLGMIYQRRGLEEVNRGYNPSLSIFVSGR